MTTNPIIEADRQLAFNALDGAYGDGSNGCVQLAQAIADHRAMPVASPCAKPFSEWHDDDSYVTWWRFPVEEPSWIGTPNCRDWPYKNVLEDQLFWTPHPEIPESPPS